MHFSRNVLLLFVFVVFFQLIAIEVAEARRGIASQQELHFVSFTKIPGPDGATVSLCHLTTKNHILTIGLWRSSDGYALSTEKCEGNKYGAIGKTKFEEAQGLGLIPAELPSEPEMTSDMIISGFTGLGGLALLVAFGGFKFLRSQQRRSMRHGEMAGAARFEKMLLDAMCHAALSDGEVEVSEITLIQKTATNLTGRNFTAEKIEALVRSCDKRLTPMQFKAFGKGLDIGQKATIMQAALMVVSADRDFAKTEQDFIAGLAAGLGMSAEMLQKIAQET